MESRESDLTILQREFVGNCITLEPFTKKPRIFDVDDAIHLNHQGHFAKYLAERVDLVIAGNQYLASWYNRWNSNVVILPTAVDTDKFRPLLLEDCARRRPIIGWTGSWGNLRYLYQIEPALKVVLNLRPDAILRIVSDRKPQFKEIPSQKVEFIQWTPENEAITIQEMTIGIMPLEDSDWARGKCSFKMLLYMACGLPVTVSPVGMNQEILRYKGVGFGPETTDEWVEALLQLLDSEQERKTMGNAGRLVVEERYSVQGIAGQLAAHIKSVVN